MPLLSRVNRTSDSKKHLEMSSINLKRLSDTLRVFATAWNLQLNVIRQVKPIGNSVESEIWHIAIEWFYSSSRNFLINIACFPMTARLQTTKLSCGGPVDCLKILKRQMAGRIGVRRLRRRVVSHGHKWITWVVKDPVCIHQRRA